MDEITNSKTKVIIPEIENNISKAQKNNIVIDNILASEDWFKYVYTNFIENDELSTDAIHLLKLTNTKFLTGYNSSVNILKNVNLFIPMLRGIAKRVNERKAPQSIEDCSNSLYVSIKTYYDKMILEQEKLIEQMKNEVITETSIDLQAEEANGDPIIKPAKIKIEKNTFDLTTQVLMLNKPWQEGSGKPKYKNVLEYENNFYYVFDEVEKLQNDSVSQMMSSVIDKSDLEVNINPALENKEELISQIISEAIEQALEHKNGNLYIEPIGLGFDEITPEWLANIIADKVFSLKLEEFNKLDIYIPVLENFDKHMAFKDHWQKRLVNFKLSQYLAEKFEIDLSNIENLEVVNQAVEALLSSNLMSAKNRQLITIINFCLRDPLAINASDFQRQGYESNSRAFETFIDDLFGKNVFVIDEKIIRLADNYLEHLTGPLAIELEKDLIKQADIKDLALGFNAGFSALSAKGKAIGLNTLLVDNDLNRALMQLALEKPEHSEQLVNVKVVHIRDVEAALIEAKKTDRCLTHFIINTGGHWTRLKIDRSNPDNVIVDYVDSIGGSGSWLSEIIDNLYPGIKVSPHPLGDQHDGWSCGYHALAGIVNDLIFNKEIKPWRLMSKIERDIGIQTDSTQELRNWVFNLVTGQTFDRYMSQDIFKKPELAKPTKKVLMFEQTTETDAAVNLGFFEQLEKLSLVKEKLIPGVVLPLNIRIRQQEFSQKSNNLLSQMRTAESVLVNVDDATLLKNHLEKYHKQFNDLNDQFKEFKIFACSEQNLQPQIRSQIIERLDQTMLEVKNRLLEGNESLIIKQENEKNKLPQSKSINPLSRAVNKKLELQFNYPKMFEPLSKQEEDLFGAISKVINKATTKGSELSKGKKIKDSKINKMLSALNDIKLDVGRSVLELSSELSDENIKQIVDNFKLLNIVIKNNSNETLSLNEQDKLEQIPQYKRLDINIEISELNDDEKIDHRVRYEALTSHRHRLILKAWDDIQSDFYNALNIKETSYLGIGFTLFSGSSWFDIINGDAALIKDIKESIKEIEQVNEINIIM